MNSNGRSASSAAAEGLSIELVTGDAEALPFPDASFDAVISCVGVMFAPDQERAAAELLRVCRPGGTIALANWTPTGFIGDLFRTVGAHVPPPAGVKPPALWGTEDRVRELLAGADVRLQRREFVFRARSAPEFAAFFRDCYGPVHKAFAAADAPQQLYADLVALARRRDIELGPTVAMPAEYLEIIATRR